MATRPDYYIVTFDTGERPFRWAWELRRHSEPMGVRISDKGYRSEMAAKFAGKRALETFLCELEQYERRK